MFITNPGRGTAGKCRNSCFFFLLITCDICLKTWVHVSTFENAAITRKYIENVVIASKMKDLCVFSPTLFSLFPFFTSNSSPAKEKFIKRDTSNLLIQGNLYIEIHCLLGSLTLSLLRSDWLFSPSVATNFLIN